MIVVNWLRETSARLRIGMHSGISIDPSADVLFHQISFKRNARLQIGHGSIVQAHIVSDREGAVVEIGRNSYIGSSHIISASRITVGDDVLISWGCHLVDHDSHSAQWSKRQRDVSNWRNGQKNWEHVSTAPIAVGNKAWIGFNSIILKGVTIGEGAVVGAGSVVTSDVPPFTVVAGNPARVIRELSAEERV